MFFLRGAHPFLLLFLALILPLICHGKDHIGDYYGQRFGRNMPKDDEEEDAEDEGSQRSITNENWGKHAVVMLCNMSHLFIHVLSWYVLSWAAIPKLFSAITTTPNNPVVSDNGGGMSGVGLIFLILAIVAILGGIYFAAWCLCSVQRSRKEGHYILDSEEHDADPELYGKKLYSGLGKN